MTAKLTAYRPDVDGLRAIAVLSVVLCHAGIAFPGGFVGVDVFFVISGYLITGLILKELEQGTFSLAQFWERRIRRIFPALFVVTVATLVAGWFLLLPNEYAALGKSVVALALLISNVQFWKDTGYFEAAAEEKPLLHTWSLAVEEQFYLFVPVFLLLLVRTAYQRRAVILLVLALIASLSLSILGTHWYPGATFYLLPTRAWELFAGLLLALLPIDWSGRLSRCKELAAVLGLVLILVPCVFFDHTTRFPGLAAVPPVLGTALLICCGEGSGPRLPIVSRALVWHPFVAVGIISYSLYLWHWPLFAFARSQSIYPLNNLTRLLLVAASVLIGAISHRYVERPFRCRRVLVSRQQLWTATAFGFVCLFCSGLFIHFFNGIENRLPAEARLFASTGRRDVHNPYDLFVEMIPNDLAHFGNTAARPELLIWGDSHAMAILPAIDCLCHDSAIAACAATHPSTAPVIGYFSQTRHGLNERAIAVNAAVLDYVRSEHIPKVLLAAFWSFYFNDDAFPDALLKTIDALQADGVTVYFMKDVPVFSFDVPNALTRYSMLRRDPSALALASSDYEAMNHFHASFLPRLIARGVHILDPIPAFQLDHTTRDIFPFDPNGSFYRDKQHLSAHGALALKPMMATIFTKIDDR